MQPSEPRNGPEIAEVELAKRIERQIVLGTWGRIHDLRVEVSAGRVVVHGRTPTHYIKQLVLQAVIDVLGPDTSVPIEMNIRVGLGETPPRRDELWGTPRF